MSLLQSVLVRSLDFAGHNGAGKSTLLKVLSGVYRPDEGTVILDGTPIELTSPHNALSRGIATVHQELSLLRNLTAMQNIFLARERTRIGLLQLRAIRAEAEEMVKRFGLDIDVDGEDRRIPRGDSTTHGIGHRHAAQSALLAARRADDESRRRSD